MMDRIGFAEFELEPVSGAVMEIERSLEVSLDCVVCQRRMRTVIFPSIGSAGRCTPTGHEFPGHLARVTALACGGRYEFNYHYQPFTDRKYPTEERYGGVEKGAPRWVRFYFHIRCSRCARVSRHSVQTNLSRPYRIKCDCGAVLFADLAAPRLGWSVG